MAGLTKGLRPDITPAQIIAFIVVGVPALLTFFGVELAAEQADALDTLLVAAVGLILGDAGLRVGRGLAQSRVDAALVVAPPMSAWKSGAGMSVPSFVEDPEADDIPDDELPSDEEELASPPPDDETERKLYDRLAAGEAAQQEGMGTKGEWRLR